MEKVNTMSGPILYPVARVPRIIFQRVSVNDLCIHADLDVMRMGDLKHSTL